MQVRNHRRRITRVEGRGASGADATWHHLVRIDHNYPRRHRGDGLPALRMTDNDAGLTLAADTEVAGATYFPTCAPQQAAGHLRRLV